MQDQTTDKTDITELEGEDPRPEPVKPMTPAEFEVIRLHLGEEGEPYPLSWLCTALGYKSSRQAYRWLDDSNETQIPGCVAKHMRRWYHQGYVD